MVEITMQRGAAPHGNAIAMCPMAKMCARMMEKPRSGFLLMLPGALLIVLGVFIFLEPRIAAWLVGSVAVLMGLMLLVMAHFVSRSGVRAGGDL
jgi:uncharacterized membrane protein HdeD (DUF308 family)